MKKRQLIFSTLALFALFELVFLYFLKYRMNYVPFSEFSIFNIGNLINLLFTLSVLSGLALNYFLKKETENTTYYLIFILSFIQIALLSINWILFKFELPLPDFFLFNYPSRKIFTGAIFVFEKLIQIFIIGLLWNSLFNKGIYIHIKAISAVVITVTALFLFTFVYHMFSEREYKGEKKYDVAVVLGAAVWSNNKPSTLFKGRILKTYELYKKGNVEKIQLTGGNAPGEISEARAAGNLLLELGVDPSDIWLEENTSTTSEQIKYIKSYLVSKKEIKNIVIISDDFHLIRVLEMCRFFNVNADGVTSDYEISWEKLLYYRFRDTIGLLLFWIFAI